MRARAGHDKLDVGVRAVLLASTIQTGGLHRSDPVGRAGGWGWGWEHAVHSPHEASLGGDDIAGRHNLVYMRIGQGCCPEEDVSVRM